MSCRIRRRLRARLFAGVCEKHLGQIQRPGAKSGVEMRSLSQHELLSPWRNGKGGIRRSQKILQNNGLYQYRLSNIGQKFDLFAGK